MHFPQSSLTRRSALKTLGAGVALLTLARPGWAQGASGSTEGGVKVAETPQPFVLPPLSYAYDALEPHFDARTMEIHHTKHHQAYITAANKALAERPDLRELSAEQLLTRIDLFEEPLRATLRNQVGGHLNHAFFWTLLAAPATYRPGRLRAALDKKFGSLENFQKAFAQAAASRFGSGWAWLVVKGDDLAITSTANQDSPIMQGEQPVIGLDVWEHAYYLHYQNRRADYVQAFWKVLNWDAAEAAYAQAVGLGA
ncbi:MAG: superoxide dismutase [Opitutaceae bacterium]|jgi:Fe-Mn family superoxide dismutase|nr:superoxide dismutase [Opitutaceae bacterium]